MMTPRRNNWQSLLEERRSDVSWPKKYNLFDFRVSNCGRYGFFIYDVPIPQVADSGTHIYLYIFEVMDSVTNRVSLYKQMTGPFKTYHRFYLLNESLGVLVDFSRNDGCVGQHLLEFDHLNETVYCHESRYWKFAVDEMLFQTDGTYVTATNDLLQIRHFAFLPLLGQVDYLPDSIILRLVPADPRPKRTPLDHDLVSERTFVWDPSVALRHHLREITDDRSIIDQARITPDYPLLYGDTLWFFLSRRMDFDDTPLRCLDTRYILAFSMEQLLFSTAPRQYVCEASGLDEDLESHSKFDFGDKLELLNSDQRCTLLHELASDFHSLKPDSYIESYTYVHSTERSYLRLDFWEYKHKWTLNSEWVTLDLGAKKWFSWKVFPTSNKLPFWFSALPDGRMIIYRKQKESMLRNRLRKRRRTTEASNDGKVEESPQQRLQIRDMNQNKFGPTLLTNRRFKIQEPPRKVRDLKQLAFDVSQKLAVQFNQDPHDARLVIDFLKRVCQPY